jgi:hypothetical protein
MIKNINLMRSPDFRPFYGAFIVVGVVFFIGFAARLYRDCFIWSFGACGWLCAYGEALQKRRKP